MKHILLSSLFLGLISVISLSACSPKAEDKQEVPPPQGVGPFDVQFSNETNTYEHSFKVNIKQNDGKVDYLIKTDRSEDIIFEQGRTLVVGCDALKIRHEVYWVPDDNKPTTGQMLGASSHFTTGPLLNGKLIHQFYNLGGCTSIEVTTKLRRVPKLTHTNKPCEGYTDVTSCQVEAYCRESYTSNFVEVEIWHQGAVTTMHKFMNYGTGNRSQMSMSSARMSISGDSSIYSSTFGEPSTLQFNQRTGEGFFDESVMGHHMNYKLNCDL